MAFPFVNQNIWLIKYTVKFYESLWDLYFDSLEEFLFFKVFFENRKSNYLCVYCFNKNFFVDSQEVQGYKIKIKKVGLVYTFMSVFFCVEIKTIGNALTAKD